MWSYFVWLFSFFIYILLSFIWLLQHSYALNANVTDGIKMKWLSFVEHRWAWHQKLRKKISLTCLQISIMKRSAFSCIFFSLILFTFVEMLLREAKKAHLWLQHIQYTSFFYIVKITYNTKSMKKSTHSRWWKIETVKWKKKKIQIELCAYHL